MEFYDLFENVRDDINLFEAMDEDQKEVQQISRQYKFGTIEWQDAMIARIKRKLQAKEPLTGMDNLFIDTQIMHNRRLLEELKACGLTRFDTN